MNEFGDLVQRHWERERPTELATIEDPQAYFTQVGEEIAAEIQRRVDAEEHHTQDEISEDYLANLAHLTTLRARIETEVLDEYLRVSDDSESPTG